MKPHSRYRKARRGYSRRAARREDGLTAIETLIVQGILSGIIFVIIFVMNILGLSPSAAMQGPETPTELLTEVRALWGE